MRAWVLDGPGELRLSEKPVPQPAAAEVLVRIGATAVCGTDLEVIGRGAPALVRGGLPFNQNFTPGHEYMGTVAKLGAGVDEFAVGDRVAVEIHAGCGRCERCREGMYTSCLNYGMNYPGNDKGHRANGFTTDGGFAEYAVNHVNTLVRVPPAMSDEEATLIVTAGTATYGLDVLGGLIAGQSLVVIGPGPIGLMAVGVGKALGAAPVILIGTQRDRRRLDIGRRFGADETVTVDECNPVEAVRRLTHGRGVNYAMECSGAPNAVNQAAYMVSRGGRICLAAFAHEPVLVDVAHLVSNNIYVFGIRGEGRSATRRAAALLAEQRFPAGLVHTHTFSLVEVPTAIRYAAERVEDAIKVVVKIREP
ncbi:MAG: alcohol dehydrogenase catalytic domain-containing protein [Betaproteobacteria bacterium]|nr:alcohol dehydrogenase catalytic domain-containing protein [Betaproteobacteria bacterium]